LEEIRKNRVKVGNIGFVMTGLARVWGQDQPFFAGEKFAKCELETLSELDPRIWELQLLLIARMLDKEDSR
jgi:hypothetical protein